MRTEISTNSLLTGSPRGHLDISVIIVSFNTESVLKKCLEHVGVATESLDSEVIVVDNNSRDGSADMVAIEFPEIRLIRSSENLGFAAANNLAFRVARGRFLVLLNSDAFVSEDGIRLAFDHMQADPGVGAGGARLIGSDGSWQPSVRMFPSILNGILTFTGLAARYPKSRFLGRADRTWEDSGAAVDADWVPGAFTIIRKEALERTGGFDESFFLYYEEVDLCHRLRHMGYRVRYFPDVEVIHLGGESSKQQGGLSLSASGKQLTLWRLRSEFLYYRKYHGGAVRLAMWSERVWHRLRWARNIFGGANRRAKADLCCSMITLIDQAWRETDGGRFAPPRPW
jgi:hypothetical protein